MTTESERPERARRLGQFARQLRELQDQGARTVDDLAAGGPRYDDQQLVAEGGHKRIYRVYDRHTGMEVAMARLADATPEGTAPFVQEAQLQASLAHANVVPIYDVGFDDSPYFTMKLLTGPTLADGLARLESGDKMARKELSLLRLLEILERICDAVGFAHARGVAHLDLKPENVRLDGFGEVLVCDWGCARRFDEDGAGIGAGREPNLRQGTIGYMAPEQFDVRNGFADERSDVFALGAILYEMLSLRSPFPGDNRDEIRERTIACQPTPPREVAPQAAIPSPLEAVCLKAMAKEPDERYPECD